LYFTTRNLLNTTFQINMKEAIEVTKAVHQGKNVKRIREILGIKQDTLAIQMGLTQQAVSQLEQKETLDSKQIEEIARILKVSPDIIRHMTDEAANNFINTFNDHSGFNFQCTFNPLDKYIEAMEANKALYERLLVSEKEKLDLLQKVIDTKLK
jgi:transcriptional regulator with XRE-family HTH domain